jgi:hypothetical protein
MGFFPLAFSVHHFINSVGSDAGFASIIGLAILVLLYFAQARETASLREQAYESGQQIQQLEGRIAQLSRQQQASPEPPALATGAPVPAPAAVRSVATSRAVARAGAGSAVPSGVTADAHVLAGAPAAPAGVGAPALTAATKLIPTSDSGILEPAAATPISAPDRPIDATSVLAPPATVAGAANGAAREQGQPRPVVGGPAPVQPPPRMPPRPGTTMPPGRRPVSPPRSQPPRAASSRGRRALVALLIGLALAAVVAGLLILTSNGSSHKVAGKSVPATSAPSAHHRSKAAAFNPSSVTVAVLNGTATSGLAHRVALKLGGGGYKQGLVATAADQTHTATVVAYTPGHKRDALEVATLLKLGPASVQPVDQSTQAVACPPTSACATTVIVTAGSDLANT